MKNYSAKFFLLLIVFSIAVISCEKNNTDDGVADPREKFLGSWTCSETSQQFGQSAYTINITSDNSSSNQILIRNFYKLGNSTYTIAGVSSNALTISNQIVNGDTLNGSGSYSDASGKISFTFTVRDGQTVDNVTASCSH